MINDPQMQPGVAFPISPASSRILNDKFENQFINTLWNNVVYYKTVFEAGVASVYITNSTGSSVSVSEGLTFAINNVTAHYGDVDVRPLYVSGLSWQRDSRMRLGFQVDHITGQTIYLIRGSQNVVSPYYGFKVVDATLYGIFYAGTGSEYTVNLQQIVASSVSGTPPVTIANSYVCEAQYTANDAIKFLVNGQYVGMIRVNTAPIVSTAATSAFYNFRLTTNENTGKTLAISFFEYIQDK